jgi:hypothetical protein
VSQPFLCAFERKKRQELWCYPTLSLDLEPDGHGEFQNAPPPGCWHGKYIVARVESDAYKKVINLSTIPLCRF